ncbi:hypothetical protein [Bradyrhizobium sp. NBAIM08]|uniref:hypothetical protein n=1 Tax=Bradyrhizobium sp. NBAIM08 TaxID=2793815 RepID=UPI0004B2B131
MRAQNTFDRRAVARHLDDHLILEAECLGKGDKPIVDEIYAELSDYCSVLQDRHLGERSVDVHADDLHAWFSFVSGASGLHDIYGSALAAQPGKS